MVETDKAVDRRDYLKLSGIAGIATMGLAGCLEDSGNGDGNGNGDDEVEGDGENEIVAGTAPGFEPFEMVEDGDLIGFDVDLLEAVVEETEYELAGWEQFDFDGLIPAVDSGNIDVIAAAMTINDEREEQIAFTDPYYSADQSVLVESGGDFDPSEFSDLEGREVGAQSGTTGEALIDEELSDVDYKSFGSYVLAVEDLERGLLDAIVIDEPVGESFAGDRDVEVAFTFETDEEYGFGIRQDNEDLQSALSDGIAAVKESGTYEELTKKWFDE